MFKYATDQTPFAPTKVRECRASNANTRTHCNGMSLNMCHTKHNRHTSPGAWPQKKSRDFFVPKCTLVFVGNSTSKKLNRTNAMRATVAFSPSETKKNEFIIKSRSSASLATIINNRQFCSAKKKSSRTGSHSERPRIMFSLYLCFRRCHFI